MVNNNISSNEKDKPISFRAINAFTLNQKINTIRKKANLDPIRTGYIDGFINNDYYIGITVTLEVEVVKCEDANKKNSEIKELLNQIENLIKIYNEKKQRYEKLVKIAETYYKIANLNTVLEEEQKQENYFLDEDCFFHGTSLNNAISILNEKEISCNFRRGILASHKNSIFNIFITKRLENNSNLCFTYFIKGQISFILDKNIKLNIPISNCESDENVYRRINHPDEYQVNDSIPLTYIKAISIPLDCLSQARIICDVLQELEIDLPIVDIENQKILTREFIYKHTEKIEQ